MRANQCIKILLITDPICVQLMHNYDSGTLTLEIGPQKTQLNIPYYLYYIPPKHHLDLGTSIQTLNPKLALFIVLNLELVPRSPKTKTHPSG